MSHTCHTCHTCHTHVTHVTHVTHMHHTNNTVPHKQHCATQQATNNAVPHQQHSATQQPTHNTNKQHCATQTTLCHTTNNKQLMLSMHTQQPSILSLCILPDNQSSDLLQCNATNNSMCPIAMQCNKQQNIQCNAMQYSLTTALREPYQHTLCCNAVQYQLPESCNRSTSDLIFYMMRCDGSLVRMNHTYLSFTLQAI